MAETSILTKLVMWFFVGVGALVLLGVALGERSSRQSAEQESQRRAELTPEQRAAEEQAKAERDTIAAAKHMCRTMLKKSLNDPDSVQWDESPGWYYTKRDDGTILFQPRARAKNAFGAYMAGVWDCVVLPDGKDVRFVSLKQIRP